MKGAERESMIEICPYSTFSFTLSEFTTLPKLFIVSQQESEEAEREVKRWEKYALGEISLFVILHAANTDTETNMLKPN